MERRVERMMGEFFWRQPITGILNTRRRVDIRLVPCRLQVHQRVVSSHGAREDMIDIPDGKIECLPGEGTTARLKRVKQPPVTPLEIGKLVRREGLIVVGENTSSNSAGTSAS